MALLFISPFRDRGWVYAGFACDGCLGCCPALFYPELCWWMLCCAILYSFSALLCCANMDWPIGYGWQGTVWADRCLGQSCWAGLVLTGGLGWMDPCSRASRGGGPKSRLKPGSETVMRGTMCQDWQNSSTTRYPHQYPLLLISPRLFSPFCLSDTSHPLTKHFFSPFSLCSGSVLVRPPPSSTFCLHIVPLLSPVLPFLHMLTGRPVSLRFICVHACVRADFYVCCSKYPPCHTERIWNLLSERLKPLVSAIDKD